ncbi:upstream activation factor subunit UAF30 isoform X2 [Ricinus communis]|uniref:Upstream activation factor subunit UAF30, putative n=1 Tax=Ricinus communis TaxID=3988 RepID=B9S8L0_RICCO|nr:upstream activation factor subunit UAF30 isoform X2 [Ricinus communis]EEF40013.1 Upstream activation factor subunit UAF30, putative [Ricinus communis]|eukprot:XP_002522329.1 upstream activation factor subunit UAF30 isoform X2 [Ricinus communis]
MVSDSELIERLREFLKNSDLNTTTTGIVRRQLEEDFGIDLSDKKAFIREQVDLFLQSQFEENDQNEEEEQEDDDDQRANVKSEQTDGDNDDDEEEESTASNGTSNAKRRSNEQKNEGKKRGGGFSKLCSLSPQLQELTGVPQLARTEVVKQLWSHIREKKLQDPNNRRNIICDEPFRALFGVDSIDMFQMNKVLSKHIWPLDSDGVVPAKSEPKEKQRKQEREEEPDEPKRKEKRRKGEKSGFLAPLQLSDALIKFFGTGENALSRADVIKRMWEYIKQNNLQDPSDKRRIICDEKLKELFDVDTFNGFTVTKLLSAHFVKT